MQLLTHKFGGKVVPAGDAGNREYGQHYYPYHFCPLKDPEDCFDERDKLQSPS